MIHPYRNLPARSHWRSAVADGRLDWSALYRPKFALDATTRIATAGSCFAQHIGGALRARGWTVIDEEPAPPMLSAATGRSLGYGLFSARYGNVYSSRQMLQLFREAFGDLGFEREVWTRDGRFHDAARPNVEAMGHETLEEMQALRREQHLPAVRRVFERAQVLVFTLGLTEIWESRRTGEVFPSAPGVIAGDYDPERHGFRNLTHDEVVVDCEALFAAARAVNPELRVLLTVSPVPLMATATGDHVLAATSYSKAVLRAAAGVLAERHAFVDYFPSFEIVASPPSGGRFFAADQRSVTPDGVETVMATFFAAFGEGDAAPIAAPPTGSERFAAHRTRLEAVCDDDWIETAAP